MVDITLYPFALYVFLLVCAAIWVYGKVIKKEKKEDKGGYEKEQRLFKMYQNIEDMLNAFEEYTEEAKKEMDKNLSEIRELTEGMRKQPEKQVIKEDRKEAVSNKIKAEEKSPLIKKPEKAAEEEIKAADRIPLMVSAGMSRSEIAKELGLSIREVSLIMDIKKIKTNED